jgi:eukaryotic-like serine/threonine-protein kinase
MRQSPTPLQRVDEGSAVNVTVSAGAQTHPVPDVTPYVLKEATRRLEALDFRVAPIKMSNSTLPAGRVIRTDPAAGTVQRVGTTIKVYYSAGFVPVPNVVGEQRLAAIADLKRAHFVAVPSYQPGDAPKGTVVDQDPNGLTPRPFGSTVVIFVSLGPTPTSTPETTPTSSAPTSPTTSPPTSTPPTSTPPTSTPPSTTTTTTTRGRRR